MAAGNTALQHHAFWERACKKLAAESGREESALTIIIPFTRGALHRRVGFYPEHRGLIGVILLFLSLLFSHFFFSRLWQSDRVTKFTSFILRNTTCEWSEWFAFFFFFSSFLKFTFHLHSGMWLCVKQRERERENRRGRGRRDNCGNRWKDAKRFSFFFSFWKDLLGSRDVKFKKKKNSHTKFSQYVGSLFP